MWGRTWRAAPPATPAGAAQGSVRGDLRGEAAEEGGIEYHYHLLPLVREQTVVAMAFEVEEAALLLLLMTTMMMTLKAIERQFGSEESAGGLESKLPSGRARLGPLWCWQETS
eukprot:RCo029977